MTVVDVDLPVRRRSRVRKEHVRLERWQSGVRINKGKELRRVRDRRDRLGRQWGAEKRERVGGTGGGGGGVRGQVVGDAPAVVVDLVIALASEIDLEDVGVGLGHVDAFALVGEAGPREEEDDGELKGKERSEMLETE